MNYIAIFCLNSHRDHFVSAYNIETRCRSAFTRKTKSDITGRPDGATCADYGDVVLRLI